MPKASIAAIPSFKLYGETAAWPTPDLIHCESIPARSRLHGWEIKPHRHADLVQLLYIQSGQALLKVEDLQTRVSTPALQVVPALSVHTFKFSEDIQGQVFTLAPPLVERLSQVMDSSVLSHPAYYAIGPDDQMLDALFMTISQEYSRPDSGRDSMLQALITVLLIWLGRRGEARRAAADPQARDRGREHLQAFTVHLESHFREHLNIEQYAAAVGVSAAHLNALCRRLSGQSALQRVNERLLLEAKRNLVYTSMTINQVSDYLGFSEPAYFSRFFKRCTGQSPKQFRIQLAGSESR